MLVNDADQARKVRAASSGAGVAVKKQLVEWRESTLDGVADLVCGLVDIAKSMRFVNDGEVPCDLPDVRLFGAGKLVGTDDDLGAVKRVEVPLLESAR